MKQDLNVWIFRSKAASGGPLENGANIRKLAAIGPSYAGFQAFLTTLERDGHRFKPTTHVLNTGLPLTKPKTPSSLGWYSKGRHVCTQLLMN
jgi:hypothetical protein